MFFLKSGPFLRLLVATFTGSILGIPFRHQPGGIRTHMLVAVGAAMFCVTATRLVGPTEVELLRIIQGIASGIGFVGAATVFKRGGAIRGVNVAASIWVTAAIACEVGLGSLLLSMVMAPCVAVLAVLFELVDEKFLGPRPAEASGEGDRHPRTPAAP